MNHLNRPTEQCMSTLNIDGPNREFRSDVLDIAMTIYHAGCGSGDDYNCFMARLWDDYLSCGRPTPRRGWIEQKLQGAFKFAIRPPEWFGSEPNWAFHQGAPMVFIHQTPVISQNPVTNTSLGYGMILYVFGIRVADPKGFYRLMYKMIEEHPNISGSAGVQSNSIWIGEPSPTPLK